MKKQQDYIKVKRVVCPECSFGEAESVVAYEKLTRNLYEIGFHCRKCKMTTQAEKNNKDKCLTPAKVHNDEDKSLRAFLLSDNVPDIYNSIVKGSF